MGLRSDYHNELSFKRDETMAALSLNYELIPLPKRPKPWPRVLTHCIFDHMVDEGGKAVMWAGTMVPDSTDLIVTDVHKWCNFLLEQGAESALTKMTAIFIGGRLAPIIGGILTLLVPSVIASQYQFKDKTDEGTPVYLLLSGFNL